MCGYLESQLATVGPWLHPDLYGKGRVLSFRKAWATATGFPDILFHDLRRAAVRNMERAGMPRNMALAIIGHKTQSIYQRYDNVDEKDLKEAGSKLNRHILATAADCERL